jgi:hypothetical protein
MGDVTRVDFTTATMRSFAKLLGAEIAAALGDRSAPVEQPPAADRPKPLNLEPWHIFDPRRQTVCAAYVDGEQQQRWVPIADEAGVPATWRKIYLTVAAS